MDRSSRKRQYNRYLFDAISLLPYFAGMKKISNKIVKMDVSGMVLKNIGSANENINLFIQ